MPFGSVFPPGEAEPPIPSTRCPLEEDYESVKKRRQRRRRRRTDGPHSNQQEQEQDEQERNIHQRPLPHRKTDRRRRTIVLRSMTTGASRTRGRRQHVRVSRFVLGGTVAAAAAAAAAVSLLVLALFQSGPCCLAEGLKLASAVPPVVTDLPVRPASGPAAPPSDKSGGGGGGGGGGRIEDGDGGGGGGIGDMTRSDSSSSRFFHSIDRDGDGILEKPEMESFVRETIGGSAFDTSAEVEAGVDQVLESLDRDHDEGLDRGDVLAYWMQLESLLTAEEVSEWVVHAVQLPESVGGIFLEHHVTGYDFPELVDHNGEAIEKELGIEKNSYRKKILRHINARMLGIGTVPTPPQSFKHTLESCSAVSLSWSKSTAKGFPVHSYRVQRRAVPLHAASPSTAETTTNGDDSNSGNGEGGVATSPKVMVCDAAIDTSQTYFPACVTGTDVSFTDEYALACAGEDSSVPEHRKTKIATKPATANTSAPSPPKSSSWLTVYRGGDNEFVDTGLGTGNTYLYRVQAWNSVGRSEWVTLDIARSLKKQGCTVIDKAADSKPFSGVLNRPRRFRSGDGYGWNIVQTLYLIFDFISTFVRAIFALAAIGAAIMRFKRANALSSTSANLDPVFPWLWRGINVVSYKIFGVEIVPKSMLGDKNSKRVSESIYDREVKSVGLVGYKSPSSRNGDIRSIDTISNGSSMPHPNRRVMFGQRKSASTGTLMASLDKINENDLLHNGNSRVCSLQNEHRGRDSNEEAPSRITSTENVANSRKKSSFNKNFFRRSKSVETDDTLELSEEDARLTARSLPVNISTSKRSLMENVSMSTIDEDNGTIRTNAQSSRDLMDDYNRCNSCHKLYKFPHRFRHHCARCLSTFCHKHGKTTHSNLVACKVPSDCICNVCLEIDGSSSSRSRSSSRSGSSRS